MRFAYHHQRSKSVKNFWLWNESDWVGFFLLHMLYHHAFNMVPMSIANFADSIFSIWNANVLFFQKGFGMHLEIDMNPRQVAAHTHTHIHTSKGTTWNILIKSLNTSAAAATSAQDVNSEMTDNRNNQHIFPKCFFNQQM